jgi:hypothetical protein
MKKRQLSDIRVTASIAWTYELFPRERILTKCEVGVGAFILLSGRMGLFRSDDGPRSSQE